MIWSEVQDTMNYISILSTIFDFFKTSIAKFYILKRHVLENPYSLVNLLSAPDL